RRPSPPTVQLPTGARTPPNTVGPTAVPLALESPGEMLLNSSTKSPISVYFHLIATSPPPAYGSTFEPRGRNRNRPVKVTGTCLSFRVCSISAAAGPVRFL